MTNTAPPPEDAPARITARIAELGGWRGQTLAHVRQLIHDAVPDVQEEWKWAKATSPGVPVWSHGGVLCTGEVYQYAVKLTFFRGAALPDPAGLFNASLSGAARRAIDLKQGETLDAAAFRDLIRAAVAANAAAKKT
ncbi:hypothetical protein HNQ07_002448 [Deinococcus metalli]|uniref:YdhG-like domain-containing protein n=1 Tax=Deinococcus metalli TaxID=1141878 RepID=A0A7W8NNJ8_9DEIO|nr:DUF1801 domain-containing protein [Deinococcus metalli]MBB5376984.1 hypothetical protein [Deinococcus metalli]GHF46824.1 hypothetical protein GCM10017781_24120 [Deinococcus metalli]